MRLPEKSLLGRARWYPTVTSLCGKEAENLAHNALALIRLEEVLRMGRAVKDDQLFRFGGFFIIRTNLWEPWSVAAGVIARIMKKPRSEEHTSELQSLTNLVCRLLLEKKK